MLALVWALALTCLPPTPSAAVASRDSAAARPRVFATMRLSADTPATRSPVFTSARLPADTPATRSPICTTPRLRADTPVARSPIFTSPRLRADTPVARARPREPDPWFAEDKLKHFVVSFAAGSLGYGAARAVGLRHGPAIIAASGAALAAGVWKEARDRATGGDVSLRDLAWDALGVAAAAGVSANTR